MGHSSTGKTSLTEALLFSSGLTERLGNIEEGNTISDFDQEEKKRKSPPRKKPPTKKEKPMLAAPHAYGRLRRPASLASFLSSFGGCAASFSCPLRASLSSCGRLRRPSSLLLLSRFFRAAAPPLSPALSWAAGAAPSPLSYTMKSRLSETHMGIGVPLSPDCENQRFSCQGLLRLSLSEACFVTVTCHELFFFYFLP